MTTLFKHARIWIILLVSISTLIISCEKTNGPDPISIKKKPSAYSSEVLQKWMVMQMHLLKKASGPNHGFGRHFAYTGIAAFESLEPTLYGKKKWSDKWNGLMNGNYGLPVSHSLTDYYYPANVNSAMGTINRMLFANASAADKASIDSLENALNDEFLKTQPAALIGVSNEFGNKVAIAVFKWAETDGYKLANNPYTVPAGTGLWKPTPPANTAPATPYWGYNRTVIKGSDIGVQPTSPPVYHDNPQSGFYLMAKEVYDSSKTLTADQKAMADFWRDVPGATTPGHWLSIVWQLVKQKSSNLEEAALAYALAGAAINDASIACFKTKYTTNVIRPVTYIREVMGYTTWSPYLTTPAHPEYLSAHSSLSMAVATTLDKLFPGTGTFTDRTYDYLGYGARTFPNLKAIATEAGISRLYAGIHYRKSIVEGLVQGENIAVNIFK